jgi:D-inositol-3-phosphate glycosyltransferase
MVGRKMLRVAMLSYHTCPLAILGGKDTGGMNVYVRDLTRELGRLGIHVDVFTRSQDEHVPHVLHDLGYGNRVVHVPTGPEVPLAKRELIDYIPQFVDGIKAFAAEKGIHTTSFTAIIGCQGWLPSRFPTRGVELQSFTCSTP